MFMFGLFIPARELCAERVHSLLRDPSHKLDGFYILVRDLYARSKFQHNEAYC